MGIEGFLLSGRSNVNQAQQLYARKRIAAYFKRLALTEVLADNRS
jgi:hypothetical protein